MARPAKEGLDYFPLDIDMDQDDKVVIIIAKYGMQGFGIMIKLFMEIYKNGYFYQWTEKEQIIFSSRVNVNINEVKDLVSDCIKWGLFHQDIFEKHQVLTSKGIQERYLLATSRRVNVIINDDIKLVSVDINPKLTEKAVEESTQSKRKETKANKTKENNTKKEDSTLIAFDEFWKAYPKKADKQAGLKAFTKAIKKHDPQIIIQGAIDYAKQCQVKNTEKSYIKNPATFLNAESFLNEFETTSRGGGNERDRAAEEFARSVGLPF